MNQKIFRLHGQIQFYEWGGFDYIPQLLGFDNAQHKPCAEYWLGTHQSGVAKLETEHGLELWSDLIKQKPEKFLGKNVYERFGDLPYLFKVLDVREMLSIQVHPAKDEAEKGFDREEREGVGIDEKHRNYKDRNHKPEVMIALGDFWLLHGFKKEDELRKVLELIPQFNTLIKIFDKGNYKSLYRHVMEMPQSLVDEMLIPLIRKETTVTHSKEDPGYWVNKLYSKNIPAANIDKGIFSVYFFNLLHLQQGEAIFQGAGVPHAYLEGQNVELMANSDNVLRGGLTSKHIDVPELLKHIKFEGTEPKVLAGEEVKKCEKQYCLPVADFSICSIHLEAGREYVSKSSSPETYLIITGEIHCFDSTFKRGEAFMILPGTDYTIRPLKDAVMYKAYVPEASH